MTLKKTKEHNAIIKNLLIDAGFGPGATKPELHKLTGDGSDRIFYRLHDPQLPPLLVIIASPLMSEGLLEARSVFRIGTHLFDKGLPVPEILAYDSQNGAVLCSDLGDIHLQKITCSHGGFTEAEKFYRQAIDALVEFQVKGKEDFDLRFCWDTPYYDEKLMLERESGYFYRSFCRDFMGIIPDDPRIILEFQQIAHIASREPKNYLLHRDYQSRNLMVHKEKVYIIDFQGARMGPLGYDLASLLIDPYAGLTESEQEKIYRYYVESISREIAFDPDQFYEGYVQLALLRNLQILGAFAFLSQIKGKIFFVNFILPAVHSLSGLLGRLPGVPYPCLSRLIADISERLESEKRIVALTYEK